MSFRTDLIEHLENNSVDVVDITGDLTYNDSKLKVIVGYGGLSKRGRNTIETALVSVICCYENDLDMYEKISTKTLDVFTKLQSFRRGLTNESRPPDTIEDDNTAIVISPIIVEQI